MVSNRVSNCGGGPRSAQGKARSRRNAFRHGLASVDLKVDRSKRIAALAKALSRGRGDARILSAASKAARARVFIEEICVARDRLIEIAIKTEMQGGISRAEAHPLALARMSRQLLKLLRYERRAGGQWRQAAIKLAQSLAADADDKVPSRSNSR